MFHVNVLVTFVRVASVTAMVSEYTFAASGRPARYVMPGAGLKPIVSPGPRNAIPGGNASMELASSDHVYGSVPPRANSPINAVLPIVVSPNVAPLLIASAGCKGSTMRIETVFTTVPSDPVACAWNEPTNAPVGLPIRTPAAVSDKPLGSPPFINDHVHPDPQLTGSVVS